MNSKHRQTALAYQRTELLRLALAHTEISSLLVRQALESSGGYDLDVALKHWQESTELSGDVLQELRRPL